MICHCMWSAVADLSLQFRWLSNGSGEWISVCHEVGTHKWQSIIGWQAPAWWLCLWLCIDSAGIIPLSWASEERKCNNTGQHISPPDTIKNTSYRLKGKRFKIIGMIQSNYYVPRQLLNWWELGVFYCFLKITDELLFPYSE